MPSEHDWQASALRLTVFPESPLPSEPPGWWTEVSGGPPERRESFPRELRWEESGRIEATELHNTTLLLSGQPSRLDWVLRGSPVGETLLPVMGSFAAGLTTFEPIATRWLPLSPPIVRIAFGAVLFLPVERADEAHAILSELLHFEVGGADTSDFLYQINRRQTVHANDHAYEVNKVSKWAAPTFEMIRIDVGSGIGPAVVSSPMCQLELDVNSAPRAEAIERVDTVPLFRQLMFLAQELAVEGNP